MATYSESTCFGETGRTPSASQCAPSRHSSGRFGEFSGSMATGTVPGCAFGAVDMGGRIW